MQWETVIGLEVHVQLNTKSKIFSGASTAYGAAPNTQACAVDLGLPGVLPVVNEAVIRKAVKFGLAINAEIGKQSVFSRKNYFYPDLPKGYQISQFDLPIVGRGQLLIALENEQTKLVNIERAHLEEDAGKSLHEDFMEMSGIDLNRAGTPLLEVVSAPDMSSPAEAVAYLKTLHTLVCYLDICDGNMQEGSFRCDCNVSVRPVGETKLGTRTEIKNVNSFRFVERAIAYEVARQIDILESGGHIEQQTRLYDPGRNETRAMRSKENAEDYRYFPDPDLLPVLLDDSFINEIKASLPELPSARRERFVQQFGLSAYDAATLTAARTTADYFEAVISNEDCSAKLAANWMMGELAAALNKANISVEQSPISATMLRELLVRIEDNTISGKMAKTVFEKMWQTSDSADLIIEQKGLKQVTDDNEITQLIEQVLDQSTSQLEQYLAGKDKLFGYFVGQVMKLSQGKANPKKLNELLKTAIDKRKP